VVRLPQQNYIELAMVAEDIIVDYDFTFIPQTGSVKVFSEIAFESLLKGIGF
jgi:hypothetical protein